MYTVRELIGRLNASYWPDETVAAVIWSAKDIGCWLEDNGYPADLLTEDEKKAVVMELAHSHNAGIGISWNVVEAAVRMLYGPKLDGAGGEQERRQP